MKARAIWARRGQGTSITPRAVRRKAGERSIVNLGSRVARVGHMQMEGGGREETDGDIAHTNQATSRQQQLTEPISNIIMGQAAISDHTSGQEERIESDSAREVGGRQVSHPDMQIFEWQTNSHATPNWALLGPSEKGRNSVALEELDSQPEKELSQTTHVVKNNTDSTHGPSLNANVAFERMGVKREAESSWRSLKEGKKPKVLKGEGLVAEVKSGRNKQRRFTKSPKARTTTSRGQVPQVIDFSEEGLREVVVVLALTLELRDSYFEVTSAAETGGGGWPKTDTRAP
ncbi:unnamed protein product [Prunus brigantina]